MTKLWVFLIIRKIIQHIMANININNNEKEYLYSNILIKTKGSFGSERFIQNWKARKTEFASLASDEDRNMLHGS